ncbi:tyrosine-type recombinase/integrase [Clostridioides difficile]|uniref:tyrosine-type recombinase/integrase n=1 Tax=Clostridioides difficile TaxID=1496 RepID=UPI0021D3B208|nr:tyrosine-type recombinase/integrase [Clostridioides difficile]MCU5790033.1 tyrosine-type recombinase/integrase [Clostridioides difficile]
MATRPIEIDEYKKIMELLHTGFTYSENGVEKRFRKNPKVALSLMLEANLGLRISDILRLKIGNFKGNMLEINEKKTGKLQYRPVNKNIIESINEHARKYNLKSNDYLVNIKTKAIQKQLRIICKYLNLYNISTHSFRKLYATTQFEKSNNNLELVKELLNHSSVATTQRYIRVTQQAINEASENFFIG